MNPNCLYRVVRFPNLSIYNRIVLFIEPRPDVAPDWSNFWLMREKDWIMISLNNSWVESVDAGETQAKLISMSRKNHD